MPAQKDPVCGMTITATDPALKTKYQDKEYNFCCKECMAKFKKNPQQFKK